MQKERMTCLSLVQVDPGLIVIITYIMAPSNYTDYKLGISLSI